LIDFDNILDYYRKYYRTEVTACQEDGDVHHQEEEEEKALGPLGLKQEKQGGRQSKAQKRRDKKADKEREREEEIRQQEEANRHGVRQLEQEAIKKRLTERGLVIKEVSLGSDTQERD
jgi:ATPase subunit of ABC transporter with duplicated ATPase domains